VVLLDVHPFSLVLLVLESGSSGADDLPAVSITHFHSLEVSFFPPPIVFFSTAALAGHRPGQQEFLEPYGLTPQRLS